MTHPGDRRHMIVSPALDRHFPPRGRCAFCGHVDARHRLWDAIMDRPEHADILADDYDVSPAAIRLVRRLRPYRRSR